MPEPQRVADMTPKQLQASIQLGVFTAGLGVLAFFTVIAVALILWVKALWLP